VLVLASRRRTAAALRATSARKPGTVQMQKLQDWCTPMARHTPSTVVHRRGIVTATAIPAAAAQQRRRRRCLRWHATAVWQAAVAAAQPQDTVKFGILLAPPIKIPRTQVRLAKSQVRLAKTPENAGQCIHEWLWEGGHVIF
jgi:hypothetical protein